MHESISMKFFYWCTVNRGRFSRVSILTFGVPFGSIFCFLVAHQESLGIKLFIFAISLLGGYVWGWLFWEFFMKERMRRIRELSSRTE
jgi:hypothetical protein